MPTIYVARSAALLKWAGDVGLGKHIYKVGVTDGDPADIVAKGWAGEADWKLLKAQDSGGLGEEEALERIGKRVKPVDPGYYPKLKGATGVFRVDEASVQRSLIMSLAMSGEDEKKGLKVKPVDFADFLIKNALS